MSMVLCPKCKTKVSDSEGRCFVCGCSLKSARPVEMRPVSQDIVLPNKIRTPAPEMTPSEPVPTVSSIMAQKPDRMRSATARPAGGVSASAASRVTPFTRTDMPMPGASVQDPFAAASDPFARPAMPGTSGLPQQAPMNAYTQAAAPETPYIKAPAPETQIPDSFMTQQMPVSATLQAPVPEVPYAAAPEAQIPDSFVTPQTPARAPLQSALTEEAFAPAAVPEAQIANPYAMPQQAPMSGPVQAAMAETPYAVSPEMQAPNPYAMPQQAPVNAPVQAALAEMQYGAAPETQMANPYAMQQMNAGAPMQPALGEVPFAATPEAQMANPYANQQQPVPAVPENAAYNPYGMPAAQMPGTNNVLNQPYQTQVPETPAPAVNRFTQAAALEEVVLTPDDIPDEVKPSRDTENFEDSYSDTVARKAAVKIRTMGIILIIFVGLLNAGAMIVNAFLYDYYLYAGIGAAVLMIIALIVFIAVSNSGLKEKKYKPPKAPKTPKKPDKKEPVRRL